MSCTIRTFLRLQVDCLRVFASHFVQNGIVERPNGLFAIFDELVFVERFHQDFDAMRDQAQNGFHCGSATSNALYIQSHCCM